MVRLLRPAALAISLGLALAACGETDPNSSAYWIERLKTGERPQAIRKLSEMGGKPEVIDALLAAYKEKRDQYEIVVALSKLGDRKAVPALVEALQDTTEPKTAQLAGATLLEWKVGDHPDVYLNVAANKGAEKEMRYVALQLLAAFPAPSAETMLLQILAGDPDLQPIAFNGLAGEALGKLKSAKAVDDLIYCMWLDDHLGRNEVSKCRLALNRIGREAVVPKVLETLERKNRKVEARARKFKFHIGGLVEAKAAELLGDMPSPDAVEPLIAALNRAEEAPADVMADPKRANAFIMGSVQRAISVANALAAIGDDRAVPALVALAAAKDRALEYKLTAVQQLAYLGSPKAIEPLMKVFVEEPHQLDPVSQGFRIQVGLTIANLMDGTDEKTMAAFEKVVDAAHAKMSTWLAEAEAKATAAATPGEKKGAAQDVRGYKEWKSNYEEIKTKLATVRACTTDLICWTGKLDDSQSTVRMLAAYRLAQATEAKATVVKALAAHIGEADLDVRNVIVFGLDRHADASIIPALEKQRALDLEAAKKKKELMGVAYTFDLMLARLGHTGGEPAAAPAGEAPPAAPASGAASAADAPPADAPPAAEASKP